MKHTVSRDGIVKFVGTPNECFIYVLKNQSCSVDHATKYEGWKIGPCEMCGGSGKMANAFQEVVCFACNQQIKPHAKVERIKKEKDLCELWYQGTALQCNNNEVWVCWANGLHTWIDIKQVQVCK